MRRNYRNKVCLIQSEEIFQDDTRKDYLKIKKSQLLTSDDHEEIFDFIEYHACVNNIFKFTLHIDSDTLSHLIDLMEEMKQDSRKTRKWLKRSTFICTLSNSMYVRQNIASLNLTNVHFALSTIKTVLKNTPDGTIRTITNPDGSTTSKPNEIMVVVSDTQDSYYKEVFDHFNDKDTTLVKTKVADLKLEFINVFAQGGGHCLILALDGESEYNAVGNLIKQSNFKKTVQIIECRQILSQGVADIQSSVADVITCASGVSIQANLYGLNPCIPYEACAASLTLTWKMWNSYISGKTVQVA